ncbi:MAG: ABC transporter ATP-binding protein [Clostridia bacterium]|jgi:branched-chain amino acid transport system ATP-binding protein
MTMLKISNLKVYYGQMEAVHGIDMQVKKGSITAIIGSNGAGKTTILNAISGMVEYTGTIELDGKPLSNKSNRVVKAGVVQVPEGRKVFAGLSVEENLRAGAYCIRSKKEVARLMEEQYKLFPRLRERKHQDAGTLSGGEQQMLVICRSLMAKPRLLLLDEPSLGLAPIIVKDVFENICRIRDQGVTIMLVEQNAKKSLSVCDYGFVIENGNIVCSGTGDELLNNPEIAKAYLGASRDISNC